MHIIIGTSCMQALIYNTTVPTTIACSPLRFMVLFCSGTTPAASRHKTRVSLRSALTVTTAVDSVTVVPILCVTANSNGGSGNPPMLLERRAREMLRDGTIQSCAIEEIVQVNVTVSPGHGRSALDCSWAPEPESEWHWTVVIGYLQNSIDYKQCTFSIALKVDNACKVWPFEHKIKASSIWSNIITV